MTKPDRSLPTTDGVLHCLTVIGQIEALRPAGQQQDHQIRARYPQLVAIEESSEIEGLLILLNTVGGDIEAGLAIAELIAGMKKPTVSLVLGAGIPSASLSRWRPSVPLSPHGNHDPASGTDERAGAGCAAGFPI